MRRKGSQVRGRKKKVFGQAKYFVHDSFDSNMWRILGRMVSMSGVVYADSTGNPSVSEAIISEHAEMLIDGILQSHLDEISNHTVSSRSSD